LGPLAFQPSELAKGTLIIYLGAWLAARQKQIGKMGTYLPFVGVLAVVSVLMLQQPDLGTLAVMLAIAFVMYFLAGMTWQQIALTVGVGVVAFLLIVVLVPYRRERLTTFLQPCVDQKGACYHVDQLGIAIGSGGWWGRGFGESKEKLGFLPEPQTDSIWAVTVEELGAVRALAIVLAFLVIAWRGARIVLRVGDPFGALVAAGITTWLVFQVLLNVMSMLHLIPLTGVPLPFVSYGGSSLLVTMVAVGILLSISRFVGVDNNHEG
jgi:cell division protein FtsW